MKTQRFLQFAIGLLMAGHLQAQYPLVGQHSGQVRTLRSLGSGTKLIEDFNITATTRTIYNQDLSVFRVLNYPAPPAGMEWGVMWYITEDLFDTVPATIEFAMTAYGPSNAVYIYREDGTQLFVQDPGEFIASSGAGLTEFSPIFTYDDQTYMVVNVGWSSDGSTRIYQLPGKLPCMDCSGFPTMNAQVLGTGDISVPDESVQLFPNPATHSATLVFGDAEVDAVSIFDVSGKLVRTQNPGAGRSVELSLNGLAPGHYIVAVANKGKRVASMPLVVAKD